ncbi:hypothetical protein YT1_2141 [Rhodococcus ruber]|nr:hypothetical protein YT1_2141 [Rhodococcus ruber]
MFTDRTVGTSAITPSSGRCGRSVSPKRCQERIDPGSIAPMNLE